VAGGHLSVSTTSAAHLARIVVRNGGPVIDAELAQTLTEPFRRLDRGNGGFGLGLSIVRSVARAHGGTVTVMAPSSGGLEVRVELPAVPAPANIGMSLALR
jgi:signal transduction histidine kinase